ncbi:MAG: hypothetical protein SF187_06700 [Deltaproteobacteria bacterium]|nr:hypothetical protein [Deltaproteobacteria bacterium]
MSHAFPQTHWSRIVALQGTLQDDSERHQALLEELISAYWTPVYHYFCALDRRRSQEAEDLTQQFFVMLLDRNEFQKLAQTRGTFRGFLKTAIRNFLISRRRSEITQPLMFHFAEADARWEVASSLDPELAFDREWIHSVVTQSTDALEAELAREGKRRLFSIFHDYCLSDDNCVSYQSLAQKYETNVDEIRNGLRSARQRLRHLIRKRVQQYLGPDEDLEAELAFIVGSM